MMDNAQASFSGIAADNLTVSYSRHPAVHHLSCEFAAGSLTAVVGPNGAGKSSFLAALAGHVRPTTGRVVKASTARVAYLPQLAEIDRSFPISVLDVVLLGHWQHTGFWRRINATLLNSARDALAAVELQGFEQRSIHALSVGQFQRVLFARLIAQDASIILLDEPFNAVDARTSADLAAVIGRWHTEGRTVIAVLHDLEMVRRHFPQTLLLAREAIAYGTTAHTLNADNLQRARQMAENWDEEAPWCNMEAAA